MDGLTVYTHIYIHTNRPPTNPPPNPAKQQRLGRARRRPRCGGPRPRAARAPRPPAGRSRGGGQAEQAVGGCEPQGGARRDGGGTVGAFCGFEGGGVWSRWGPVGARTPTHPSIPNDTQAGAAAGPAPAAAPAPLEGLSQDHHLPAKACVRACLLGPPSPCAGVGLCGGVLWWIERNGRKMVEAPSSSHLNTTQPFHQPTLPTTGDLYPTTPLLMCLYGKEGGVAVVVANQAFAAAFMPAERISA